MSFRHKLQASRFELKYLVDERRTAAIRDFLRSHLVLDEYHRPECANQYQISSLYLDNPGLELYKQTVHGIKNRFKLRIRFYDDDPNGPAFLEIKRRITDVIRKERAMVTREAVLRLLAGRRLDESCLVQRNGNPKSGAALQNFCNLCDEIGARGCIYVSYWREAYVSAFSDQIRVTFDFQLMGTPYVQGSPLTLPVAGDRPDPGGTILEIKFTDRFPGWMREMAQAFDLQRTSVPKYVLCIDKMGIKPGRPFQTQLGMVR
ncbi:MAG TPA: polyphosphate polymerase domain-containing protein [Thermoguttaceae bacterium]|nr:polyphosphate polymerase domain-containing protein [Thermoguttaceae bacterium]